jgi:hypothetical protein
MSPSFMSDDDTCARQVLTPALTMAVCTLFGLERVTAPLLAAVTMITLGTGVATAVEARSPLLPRACRAHLCSATDAGSCVSQACRGLRK